MALRRPDDTIDIVLADPFDRVTRLWLESRLRDAGHPGTRWCVVTAVGMHPVTAHGHNFGLYDVEGLTRQLLRVADHLPPLKAVITCQFTGPLSLPIPAPSTYSSGCSQSGVAP